MDNKKDNGNKIFGWQQCDHHAYLKVQQAANNSDIYQSFTNF